MLCVFTSFASLLKCLYRADLNYLPPSFLCEIEVSCFDEVIIAMSFEAVLKTAVAERDEYVGRVMGCGFVYQY